MTTHSATKATMTPSAICVRRVFNDRAGTELISDQTFRRPKQLPPPGAVLTPRPAGVTTISVSPSRGQPPWPGYLGLAHLPSTACRNLMLVACSAPPLSWVPRADRHLPGVIASVFADDCLL